MLTVDRRGFCGRSVRTGCAESGTEKENDAMNDSVYLTEWEKAEAKLLSDYWREVDAEMEKIFGVHTGDIGINAFRVLRLFL